MYESPLLWGVTVAAQLETLREDLRLLNSLKQTAVEAKMSDQSMPQDSMIEKLDNMIDTRLDVMISLETDQTDDEDDESESETPTEEGGQ